MEYITSPNIWHTAVGKNSAMPHDDVMSSKYPTSPTAITPGKAPAVLLIPSSAPAYFGDMSWWLQYSPARLHAPNANASDSNTTSSVCVVIDTPMMEKRTAWAASGVAGVSRPRVIMHSAGPTNAMPWQNLRTLVTSHPRYRSVSAAVPTKRDMETIAM